MTPDFPHFEDVVRLYTVGDVGYTPTMLVTYGAPWIENYWFTHAHPSGDVKLRRFTPYEELHEKALRRPGWFHPSLFSFEEPGRLSVDLARAGLPVGVGSHGQLQGLGYHWEMWSMHLGGLTQMEVLRAATLSGAQILGMSDDLGSLEPGKLADLVVLSANPLADIHNSNTIRYVMKNGRLYDGDTLDQILPVHRPAPAFSWQEAATPAVPPARP